MQKKRLCEWQEVMQKVNEKSSEATQRLRTGCSKAEPKIFASPHNPFLVTQDGQNLISWRWSPPSPTDPVWWRSMHAISSYHGNRPTNTQTHTHRQDRLQYTAPLSLACSVMKGTCGSHSYVLKISQLVLRRQHEGWLGICVSKSVGGWR